MSFIKSFSNLAFTRSISTRSLHPKRFVSILENVPIKPRNPWQIYLRENVHKYKNEDGKVDLKLATKLMGAEWKLLSDSDKEYFKNTYQMEVEAHDNKFREALNNATPQQFHIENKLRKKYNLDLLNDPAKPKRPMNAFMFYLRDLRKNKDPVMQTDGIRDQVVNAAKKFKALDSNEQQSYKDQAIIASRKYQEDMKAYRESM